MEGMVTKQHNISGEPFSDGTIYLFICVLFNYAVSSDYKPMVSNDSMINELEKYRRKRLWSDFILDLPGGTAKNQKKPSSFRAEI
jgi:hypothetical protein